MAYIDNVQLNSVKDSPLTEKYIKEAAKEVFWRWYFTEGKDKKVKVFKLITVKLSVFEPFFKLVFGDPIWLSLPSSLDLSLSS